jgi:hypothetical protein
MMLNFKTIMVTDGNAAVTDEDHNASLCVLPHLRGCHADRYARDVPRAQCRSEFVGGGIGPTLSYGSSRYDLTLHDKSHPARPRRPKSLRAHVRCSGPCKTLARRQTPAPRSGETIADMQRAGFFRVLQPKRWGGYEMDLHTFYEVQLALAEGDMSTAWIYGVSGVHPGSWRCCTIRQHMRSGAATPPH